jgi:uncharacterized protein YprB with RNaseH-like and TPR domain
MLPSTFCLVSGIGPTTERRLWAAGVSSWDDLAAAARLPLSLRKAGALRAEAEASRRALGEGNPHHFAQRLPPSEHWRLFPHFRETTAYLDIETTGMGPPRDYITAVTLYDGNAVRHYVQGRNLEDFARDLRLYRVLVTYNGKCFDAPFIEQSLDIRLHQVHLDLRHILHSLGYRGGLKGCEQQLGFERGDLAGVDGFFAVLLWQDFLEHGNERALETLSAYNVQDVINLEALMVLAYNAKLKQTPFADRYGLPPPKVPPNPFRADPDTIARIRRRLAGAQWGDRTG